MHENFYHKLKVYYEDTDAGGVVYYANYLKFLERARTEALLTIGLNNLIIKDKFDAYIIVKSCNIEYKKSAYLEDNLSIRSFIKSSTKICWFKFKPRLNLGAVNESEKNNIIKTIRTSEACIHRLLQAARTRYSGT